MGSSAKKKREKKKDFQKTKLKVGKARPKAANQTDTSFRAKAIVLNQQSLNATAPSTFSQFSHHVSLLSSKSDSQRKESLSFLTTFVSSRPVESALPQPLGDLLPKICPLMLDASSGVRTQLLKLLNVLPEDGVQDYAEKILPYIRAGMTHLAVDIRLSALDVLSWLLVIAGDEVVSCPGGFFKTMNSFISVLNWQSTSGLGQTTFGKAGASEGKAKAKIVQVLGNFLKAALVPDDDDTSYQAVFNFPYWHTEQHLISRKANGYGYLNIWGLPRDGDSQMLEDREERVSVFDSNFRATIEAGVQQARREGGEIGRGISGVAAALKAAKTVSDD